MKSKVLSNEKVTQAPAYNKVLWKLTLAVVSIVSLYYLLNRGFIYFKFSKEVYTDYFWFRAPWLLVHIVGGITAMVIGPFQFIPRLRANYPKLHRTMGKIYIGAILLTTSISFYLVSTAQLGLVYNVGVTMLAIASLCTTGIAYFAIRAGNVEVHKIWMIKSYVMTLAFVVFRLGEDLMTALNISSFFERKVLMAWVCWAIPFLLTEVILQIRNLTRKPL